MKRHLEILVHIGSQGTSVDEINNVDFFFLRRNSGIFRSYLMPQATARTLNMKIAEIGSWTGL